jgi:hypothetical protein
MDALFLEARFFLLVIFSLLLPAGVFAILLIKRMISRISVTLFGLALILLAGIDVVLLQSLAKSAESSLSLLDNRLFASELSAGLYLLPAVFAGIGVNILSHILITHLVEAEQKYEQVHPAAPEL